CNGSLTVHGFPLALLVFLWLTKVLFADYTDYADSAKNHQPAHLRFHEPLRRRCDTGGQQRIRSAYATVITRVSTIGGVRKEPSTIPTYGQNPVPPRATSDYQQLHVRLTSYIPIPKTPRTEPGENDLHYCQRTTASGDCRL